MASRNSSKELPTRTALFNQAEHFAVWETAADFVWTLANASTLGEYEGLLATLKTKSDRAHAYVGTIPRQQCVHEFSYFRGMGMSPRTSQRRQMLGFLNVGNSLRCHFSMKQSERSTRFLLEDGILRWGIRRTSRTALWSRL